MHKPETTSRSHSHNRGCTKPGAIHLLRDLLGVPQVSGLPNDRTPDSIERVTKSLDTLG